MKRPLNPFQPIAGMAQRLALMVSRVILNRVDASGPIQTAQVDGLADEVLDEVEHWQDYGFVSKPLPGAEGIMLAVAGVRSNGAVVAVCDRRYRMIGLAAGEVAIHDDQGQVVHLTRTGIIIDTAQSVLITAAEMAVMADSVTLDADTTHITGDLSVGGGLNVAEDVSLQAKLDVAGDVKLGDGAVLAVKLSDNSNATKVKAK